MTVLDASHVQHKIRLHGIDAPELKQSHGLASRDSLAGLFAGKTVTVETSKHDKYRRAVGKILLDGRDINLGMVKAGHAWHYKEYASEQTKPDRIAYARAEQDARWARLGLWRECRPVPPWAWRHPPQ